MRWSILNSTFQMFSIRNHTENTYCRGVKPTLKLFSEFIDDPLISNITTEDAEKFVGTLRMSPSSRRTRIGIMTMVFKYAIDEGLLQKNPFRHVKLPPQKRGGRILTDHDLRRFLAALPETQRRACVLGLYTGMRTSEVTSLTWDQINGDYLTIPQEKSKSKRERRFILNPKALEVLGQRGEGNVFGLQPCELTEAVTEAARKIGIGKLRFHDMRHNAATRFMDQEKPDLFALMDAFGWASADSAAHYQHMTRTRQERILGIKYSF